MSTKVIFIRPDMSFIERKANVEQNFLKLGPHRMRFSYGRSVFRERLRLRSRIMRLFTFQWFKKPRNLLIAFEGANECFEVRYHAPELKEGETPQEQDRKIMLRLSAWTKKETNEWAKKQLALASTTKILQGWRFWVLLLAVLANFMFLMLRFG